MVSKLNEARVESDPPEPLHCDDTATLTHRRGAQLVNTRREGPRAAKLSRVSELASCDAGRDGRRDLRRAAASAACSTCTCFPVDVRLFLYML
jgi:hypothetical protein